MCQEHEQGQGGGITLHRVHIHQTPVDGHTCIEGATNHNHSSLQLPGHDRTA